MKKRKKKLLLAGLALVAVVAVVLFLKDKNKEEDPEYIFTYAENQSENYPTTKGAYYFAQLVEERTNGRIRIKVYANGELGREADVIKQAQYGGIDFARVSISQMAAIDDKYNVLQMPYLYNDAEHMWKVLDGEIGEDFLEEISDYELVGLSWYDAGARSFYNSVRQIETLEDMEGLDIRVQQSSLMSDMVKALGANPVELSYEEVYSELQLGEIDGAENNWPSYEDTGHYKVAQYFTEDEHTRVPEMQFCSANTWNLLSEEDQEIILECAKQSAIYERDLWAEQEKTSKEKVISEGVIVTEISAAEKEKFRELMQPIYEKYCSQYMDLINEIIAEGK